MDLEGLHYVTAASSNKLSPTNPSITPSATYPSETSDSTHTPPQATVPLLISSRENIDIPVENSNNTNKTIPRSLKSLSDYNNRGSKENIPTSRRRGAERDNVQ